MIEDMKPLLAQVEAVIEQGPYKDDWNSFGDFQVPTWFRNAKFGIFVHWGLYSLAAYNNEW